MEMIKSYSKIIKIVLIIILTIPIYYSIPKSKLVFFNSDFENGNLVNWKFEGKAFANQPTYKNNPIFRNVFGAFPQGNFWIGTYENRNNSKVKKGSIQGDEPTGVLVSKKFKITGNYLCFYSGAGSTKNSIRVELFENDKIYRTFLPGKSGSLELMGKINWDVRNIKGKLVKLRLIDEGSGSWEHINFDFLHWC